MKNLLVSKETYFMDDPREGERLEKKVNAQQFVDKYLKEHLSSISHGVILDAGCGSGALMNTLARNYLNHAVIGVDISDDRINQANAKISDLKSSKAVMASIYDLPFPDNYFDFIYSRFLFEYLIEPIKATKELYRVCKPGGKIILQDLDGQFTFYPEVLPELAEILAVLKKQTGFDPNVGRKLFSFGKAAGFSFLNVKTELYHKVFGKIDDFNYELWHLKLDIACNYLKRMFSNELAEKMKTDILGFLKDENTVVVSNLFTMTFIKPVCE